MRRMDHKVSFSIIYSGLGKFQFGKLNIKIN